jgi:YHS domain-containing protein
MIRLIVACLVFTTGMVPLAGQSRSPAPPAEQKYCPIMTAEEIDPKTSPTVEYQGIRFFLCCDACVSRFQQDPTAYLDPKIVPALAKIELPKRDIDQVYCPVLRDRRISSKNPSTTYKGVKIYFYNDVARQRFEKDPERYADPEILPQLKKK